MSIACSSSSSSHSVPPGAAVTDLRQPPGLLHELARRRALRAQRPLIDRRARDCPRCRPARRPRVYTSWPHPTAQNGHTDSVTFSPRDPAPPPGASAPRPRWRPRPQSIARPTSGSRRKRLEGAWARSRRAHRLCPVVAIRITTTTSLSLLGVPDNTAGGRPGSGRARRRLRGISSRSIARSTRCASAPSRSSSSGVSG